MIPHDPEFIQGLLKRMDDNKLRSVDYKAFQLWPTKVITKGSVIREMVLNERAKRWGKKS